MQIGLAKSQNELSKHGILYPIIGKDFKQRFLPDFFSRDEESSYPNFARDCEKLKDMISSHKGHVILSSEDIALSFIRDRSNAPYEGIQKLYDFLSPLSHSIHILAYVRDPKEHFTSQMHEYAKRGNSLIAPQNYDLNCKKMFTEFNRIFGDNIHTIPFDKQYMSQGDAIKDLESRISQILELKSPLKLEKINSNESISAECLKALEILHSDGGLGKDRLAFTSIEREKLWRLAGKISEQVGATNKPVLKDGIGPLIYTANKENIMWMRSQGYHEFAKPADDKYNVSNTKNLQDTISVSDIFELDEAKAYNIVCLILRIVMRNPAVITH